MAIGYTQEELLGLAAKRGYRVGDAQFGRWHREGLLPVPDRQWLGKAHGSEKYIYPPGRPNASCASASCAGEAHSPSRSSSRGICGGSAARCRWPPFAGSSRRWLGESTPASTRCSTQSPDELRSTLEHELRRGRALVARRRACLPSPTAGRQEGAARLHGVSAGATSDRRHSLGARRRVRPAVPLRRTARPEEL